MSNWFKVDFYKFIELLSIFMHRQPFIIILLESAIYPIDALYGRFMSNRDANNYTLAITPQVCYLEKALNDRFDISDRRIYISDGVYNEKQYFFTRAENQPIYLHTRAENEPIYIYTRQETGADNYDFIVNVPSGLKYNRAEMYAIVQTYKLAGKVFTINEF